MTKLTCRCGSSWAPEDVVLFKTHVARCTDAKRADVRHEAAQSEALYDAADDAAELTPYEKKKQQEWSFSCTPEEAARRINALVKGRLAATARGQAKARAIPNSEPAKDDAETVDELLRQRGTGSIGARIANEEE